jgi:hypothetical integral membrane protein (TIGR02206 family)
MTASAPMMAQPFVPWSVEHLLVLALTFVVPSSLGWWARRDANEQRGRGIAWVIAIVLVVQMVGNLLLVGLDEKQRWQDFMPLHLCHLALFVCVAACVTRGQRAFDVAYFWGLGGTLQGLITPGLRFGFPSREFVSFFIGHSGIVACVVFLAIAFRLRPTGRSLILAYAWILAYAVVAGAFNAAFDTNYGFLCAKPKNPSLFDWLGPWPWYIASATALAGLLFALLYLPWAVADHLRGERPGRP